MVIRPRLQGRALTLVVSSAVPYALRDQLDVFLASLRRKQLFVIDLVLALKRRPSLFGEDVYSRLFQLLNERFLERDVEIVHFNRVFKISPLFLHKITTLLISWSHQSESRDTIWDMFLFAFFYCDHLSNIIHPYVRCSRTKRTLHTPISLLRKINSRLFIW